MLTHSRLLEMLEYGPAPMVYWAAKRELHRIDAPDTADIIAVQKVGA